MKTKLFTQNLCLGLLMTLVLALGVQGTAEAVKDPKLTQSSSDFFKFRTPNTTFSISTGTLSFDDSAAEETVTITVSSGITLTDAFIGESGSITLTESDADGQSAVSGSYFTTTPSTDGSRFSRSLTIKGRFTPTASAEQTVAISSSGWADTYTYYYYVASVNGASDAVVPLVNGSGTLTFFDGTSGSGYAEGDFGDADIQIVNGAGNNPVLYTPRSSLSMSHNNYKSGEKVSLLSGPISSIFNIHLKKNTSTDVVTAQVRGPETDIITGVYIYSFPTLEVDAPTGREKGSEENPGKPGEVIANAFTATVKDGKNRGVPGVPVKFEIPDASSTNGELGFGSGNTGTLVDESNQLISNGNTQITSGTGTTLYVRTNSSGKASVNCRLITGNVPVTVTAVGESDNTATAYTAAASGKQLTALSARSSLINADAYDLFVLVTYNGEPVDPGSLPSGISEAAEINVIFRTSDGNFGATSPNTKTTATPNSDGIAQVRFTPDGSSSNPKVTASLEETNSGVTRSVDTVTFNVTGSGDDDDDDDDNQPITRTISISPSTITGAPETTQTLTVSAGTATVRVADASAFTAAGGTISGSGTTRSITLPDTPGSNYRITFSASGYTDGTVPVIVTAPLANGTLTATLGTRAGNQQPITVRAVRGGSAQSGVNLTITGGTTSVFQQTEADGRASEIITLPTATSAHTLTVRATGYNTAEITVPAPGSGQQQQQQQQQTVGGTAESIEIEGSRTLEGTVGTSTRLRARVLDANDRGVSDVRVTFRILAPGRGRLSQRGNGRAVQVNTDRNGYATASLTPLGGNLIVEAKAAGVSAPVTFIIDVGEETEVEDTTGAARSYKVGEKIPISLQDTLTFRGSRTVSGTTYTCVGSGECVVSYGTLVKGEIRGVSAKTTASDTGEIPVIDPVVHAAAANRPPMLWVDGGGIYALVGASVERFAPSVDNALNITVGGGKVYWTEQTGDSGGTINSANLDGSGVKELASIQAVPMGIAVDTAGSKLYWTNSRGRIQSANLDGSRITNELQNLPGPKDIAVARGNVYWTQYDATAGAGSVGIANSTGRGSPKHMSTGSDTPGSLVISGNKVYWTEMTGTSSGTINRANLNGNDAEELKAILAVPMGIAVDASRSKLYWTNSRGRIQSADLDGSKVENVVDGLGGPGDMVLSNSIQAPTETTPIPPDTTETGKSKYDINGDGTVDSKDSDALVVAVAAGLTDAKYDVNGDGKVDINDVVAVSANRSAGAAGAPTLLGKQFSALEVSRLQEQIDLFIATGDRSPAAMRTLIYLQQLIAMARPEKTQLFANYPNPFNPETWMPYELATDTNVRITIYNPQGVVIRTLQLGQQSAGYYTDRERAAYWDGRNALGEQVASGIYFYQLETDEMSLMRKMVILK